MKILGIALIGDLEKAYIFYRQQIPMHALEFESSSTPHTSTTIMVYKN